MNIEEKDVETEEVFQKLKKIFDDNQIKYKLLIHGEDEKTSEEVAKLRGTPPEIVAKSKIIKRDDGFIDMVIQADK